MRNRTRLFGIYLPFFIILILTAITLRTIATANVKYFSYTYHYFKSTSIPLIANAIIAVTIVFFIIYIFSVCREIKLIPSFSSPANYIPSAAISAALVFMTLHFSQTFANSISHAMNFKDPSQINWLTLILAVFAMLSVTYFILNTIFIRTVSIRRSNFGLCMILFLGLYIAYLYFDTTAPINSPIKTVDILNYAFAAVFFLYEIRLSLGREKWKAYIIFGFIAAVLCAYSSVPTLITYFVTGKVISNSIYETVLTLTLCLFIVMKLLLTDKLIEKKEAPFIEKLKAAASKRDAELNPEPSAISEENVSDDETEIEILPDENQISILDIKPDKDITEEVEIITNNISEEELQ